MAAQVVVGVDGSEESVAALRAAIQEARFRSLDVLLVCAFSYPYLSLVTPVAPSPPAVVELEQEALQVAHRALEDVRRTGTDTTGIVVKAEARLGSPAEVLLDAAKGAELLVVGARGRGGFASLLLGSVSQQCAQHAPCPVMIVRAA